MSATLSFRNADPIARVTIAVIPTPSSDALPSPAEHPGLRIQARSVQGSTGPSSLPFRFRER